MDSGVQASVGYGTERVGDHPRSPLDDTLHDTKERPSKSRSTELLSHPQEVTISYHPLTPLSHIERPAESKCPNIEMNGQEASACGRMMNPSRAEGTRQCGVLNRMSQPAKSRLCT